MAWGVEFDAIDIAADAAARDDLRRLGVPAVPATVAGERAVHGWNPAALAALVGVAYTGVPPLPPAELAERLDEILSMAQYALERTPDEALTLTAPGRDRSLRNLGYHVFRVAAAFVDTMEQGRLEEAWFFEDAPPALRTGPELAAHGKAVRTRLAAWFAAAPADIYGRDAETYYGSQPVHELLERTAWHAGQHLRQVWALLEDAGVMAPRSLDSTLFTGLPMPEALW